MAEAANRVGAVIRVRADSVIINAIAVSTLDALLAGGLLE